MRGLTRIVWLIDHGVHYKLGWRPMGLRKKGIRIPRCQGIGGSVLHLVEEPSTRAGHLGSRIIRFQFWILNKGYIANGWTVDQELVIEETSKVWKA
jgi:hypothetical protein